jgi:hypothetical protein
MPRAKPRSTHCRERWAQYSVWHEDKTIKTRAKDKERIENQNNQNK